MYVLLGAGLVGLALVYSCSSIPEKAEPVTGFELDRYLGKWYEVARLDNRFEKNLDNVTAEYSLNENGTVKVVNSGFDTVENKAKSAMGRAKFRKGNDIGALKVSFFGPFYAGYNVIAIDPDYRYALVAGRNLDYLWILSRTDTIPAGIRQDYLDIAQAVGYDTAALVWVTHDLVRSGN